MSTNYIVADWPAINGVHAWQTTRYGGFSEQGFSELNLAMTVGDDSLIVKKNRQKLLEDLMLPAEPEWIRLVHGNRVLDVAEKTGLEDADAVYTNETGRVLLIPTADCLPVLFVSQSGDEVAAAHAGWRGLSAGVLENTLAKFNCSADALQVWFGPAIGPQSFEVGEDVRDAFLTSHPGSDAAFAPASMPGKFFADIYYLGRFALKNQGVHKIFGGNFCTFRDERFFSFRRQGPASGRMASIIWMDHA